MHCQFLHSCCRAGIAKALQTSHFHAIVKPATTVKSAEWLESVVSRAKPGTVPLSLVSFCRLRMVASSVHGGALWIKSGSTDTVWRH